MTLEEAIQHCRDKAVEQLKYGCEPCASDHLQLASWLEELQRLRKENTELRQDLGKFL